MTEAKKWRNARNLAWTGVLLVVAGGLFVPDHWGPAMMIGGVGIFALGKALHDTQQRGGRTLEVVGAAIVIAGIVSTILELISFLQH
ncbi:hypothetical protein [Arthrobacter sp. NPDC056727]|uniref:hypothetical protein n=1 Tax=Arthrobacter sp. NPDC056727 TaxID=3345927 RepID=UPI00366DA6EA